MTQTTDAGRVTKTRSGTGRQPDGLHAGSLLLLHSVPKVTTRLSAALRPHHDSGPTAW